MTSIYRSPIFELGESHISDGAKLSPFSATHLGIPGFDDKLDDYSLAGWAKKRQHVIESLDKLRAMTPIDAVDRVAKTVMQERLESDLALFNADEHQMTCAVISSPAVNIRQVFELMPFETPAEISTITKRLIAVEGALKSWLSTLDDLSKRDKVAASRQVEGIAEQLDSFSQGAFSGLAEQIDAEEK